MHMKSEGLMKPVLVAMGLALVLYIAGYSFDQHLRTRRGGWKVAFTNDATGVPTLIIDQPGLNVARQTLRFPGVNPQASNAVVVFDEPRRPVPFGRVIFEDLTYLPGTVTLDVFGHEIELIPRTLFVNRKEHPWRNGGVLTLGPEDHVPLAPRKR